MLDSETKRRIDTARDILVGKVPDPKSQVEQITIALIYKFMDDMDAESEEFGGKRKFFAKDFARYGWAKLMRSGLGGHETLNLYAEAIERMPENPGIPPLFRDIFKNAYLPYRDPETLRMFLKIIDEFAYDHSERLGDAFEYLLSVLGSQGDAGQFRTPRHVIDFMVEIVDPKKTETVLDPACGTAGFLISAYKHILRNNSSKPSPRPSPSGRGMPHFRGGLPFAGLVARARELRANQTPAEEVLWELLRDRQLCGAKFRRQHQYGEYICDFLCHEANLVVECDGPVHDAPDQNKHDQKRDRYLKARGLNVVRFQNDRILNDTENVLSEIASHLPSTPVRKAEGEYLPPSTPVREAEGLYLPPSTSGRGAGGEGDVAHYPGDILTPDEKGRLAQNFTGYDISPDMVRLSLVNMYLHGFPAPHIYEYDTLTSQDRWNEYADVILANPPFMSPKGGIQPHNRFGVQSKRSEVLFVDYMAEHLTPNGRAAIIVPEGIIFQSQTAYKQLRKMLVENALVAVVSLPAGCFNPYSGVKTSILYLDKSLAKRTDKIAFFKVENDGFDLGAQRRPIDKNDLPAALDFCKAWLDSVRSGKPPPEDANALVVEKAKIAKSGEYNLSGERYREVIAASTSWPLVPLSSICEFRSGLWKGEKSPLRVVKILRNTNFTRDGRLNLDDVAEHPVEVKQLESRLLEYGDIILEKSGGGPTQPVGRVALFNVREGEYSYSNFTSRIRISASNANSEYVWRCLHRIYQTGQTERLQKQTSGIRNLDNPAYQQIQIPLPPLSVQKEIVAEIEGYQKIIDGARAVLDHYRPHIPIHPDWPMVELGEVIKLSSGRGLTQSQMKAGPYIVYGGNGKNGMHSDYFVEAPNLVIGRVGAYCGAVHITTPKAWVTDNALYVTEYKQEIDLKYLGQALVQLNLNQFAKVGGQPSISQTTVYERSIPLPPLATQRAIVAEIEAEQALVNANRELIARMEKKIQATLARVWGEETPAVQEG